jgi:hypothetical protein
MRKVPLVGAAAALVLGLAGVVSITAVSQAAGPSPAKSKTLIFDVVFSPFSPVAANNVPNPGSSLRWAMRSSFTTSSSRQASMPATTWAPA